MGKRIRSRRRGNGSATWRSPSHRHCGPIKYPQLRELSGRVIDIFHDPGHKAPVARIRLENGQVINMISHEGLTVDQTILIGPNVRAEAGNVTVLREIPEGTSVFNIESHPGDGGQFVRTGGTSAVVVSQGNKTVVQLPSGQFKPFDPMCRATIGIIAGGGRGDKPFLKAGKRSHSLRSIAKKYPWVSGVAMNPVDHPHGGGSHQHIGRPSCVSRHAPPGRKVGHIAPKKRAKARAGKRWG